MSGDTDELLDRICGLIGDNLDTDRIKTARRRSAEVMAGRETDYLPVSYGAGGLPGEDSDWPRFNWAEQFEDPAKSLYEQLKGVLASVRSGSDALPSVRADTGVINCMTVFGADYEVPEHTKPVITEYVSKDELRQFQVPADVSECGVIPRMVDHMKHHIDALAERGLLEWVDVRHCDQQGPFDIAAQTRGHEIFVDLHADGDFVHELMEKTTDVYVAVSRLCKQINGEPLDGGNVYGVWMRNGGVRMCGDSDVLVSQEHHKEYIAPYQERAFAPFGGGWLHYCGGWEGTGRSEGTHLHESYGSVNGLRGLNWTTAGDWEKEIRKLQELGVVHIGGLPRKSGEPLQDYFRRVLSACSGRKGLIFQNPDLNEDEPGMAMDIWHQVQDEFCED
ncbi:MAG: hypothetical protein ACOCR1_04250 [Planctomycetota bacterium]